MFFKIPSYVEIVEIVRIIGFFVLNISILRKLGNKAEEEQ